MKNGTTSLLIIHLIFSTWLFATSPMEKNNTHEFFFILSPSPNIIRYVASMKCQIKITLGHSFPGEFSKAHVSLFRFYGAGEHSLFQLEHEASSLIPFRIFVKDFNVFHHGTNRTIYLEIVNKAPVCELTERLFSHSIVPHITIARNIPAPDFDRVWQVLRSNTFSDYFLCNRITVLKRVARRWCFHMDLCFQIRDL